MKNYKEPVPIVNNREMFALDSLTKRYNKLTEPSKIAKVGSNAKNLLVKVFTKVGGYVGFELPEIELYSKIMEVIESGFIALEEQATKFTVTEQTILDSINKVLPQYKFTSLDEICLARSYDLARISNDFRTKNTIVAAFEGGSTGAIGLGGLAINIVLSTLLYFRAVQSIAMVYGYDVKNNYAEMAIATDVFTNALSPALNDINNEMTTTIGKIMILGHGAVIKQTAKKTWTDMAAHGGFPLLLAQLRALANKSAQKALQKAGAKRLEISLFKEVFEQFGRKLTLKTIGKAVPVVSGLIGALIDTSQMKKVLEFADIFYHKRFILEKETRIICLLENQ